MKLQMFPKGLALCENKSPKYVNCVGRLIIYRTTSLDEGKHHALSTSVW